MEAAMIDWAKRLDLAGRLDTPAQSLSYAEQRRLDVGLALASDAPVLLLDEPTAGLSRSETAELVQRLRGWTQGRTLLMVEHDMDVVFGLADRVLVLVDGQLIADDSPDAVRANPAVQQAYLGAVLESPA
jgi:branched-chain amino acid transport system ATP-binding protein